MNAHVNIDSRFDLAATALQIQIFSGEVDPEMDFRIVPESKNLQAKLMKEDRARLRLKYRGRLSEITDFLKRKNAAGYAIFILPNLTDSIGATKDHITHARVITLDMDGAPLPEKWEVKPHLILETSPGRFQIFWAIESTDDFATVENISKRIAAFYKGDPSAADVTHVFRAAGFVHQKSKLFQSHIINHVDPDCVATDGFDRLTLDAFTFLPPIQENDNAKETAPAAGSLDADKATLILEHLSAADFASDEANGDKKWLAVAMSLHDSSGGDPDVRNAFLEWSRTDGRYDTDAHETMNKIRWDSFRTNKGKRISTGTLHKICRDHGVSDDVIHVAFNDARNDFDEKPDDDDDDAWMDGSAAWPKPLLYNPRLHSAKLTELFLSERPARIISSDGVIYTLDDEKIWRELPEPELAAEIRATDPNLNLDTERLLKMSKAIHVERFTRARPFEWIDSPADAPSPNDLILFANGILDFATGNLLPHTGQYFATGLPDFDYDPAATCPTWDRCLSEWLDPSFHDTLHEFTGYAMTPDARYEKLLALIGARRGGKSTVLRVMSWLVGASHIISRTLNDMGGEFGLEGTLDSKLMIIPDAHDTELGKRSVALDRIKTITGNDEVSVNRKGLKIVTAKVPVRIAIAANRFPKFLDESGALAARLLPIMFESTFEGREDRELSSKLRAELPGIANHALAGLARLRTNGAFTVGAKGVAAARELAESQSPALRFANARLIVTGNPADYVSLTTVFEAYEQWAIYAESLGSRERRNRDDFKSDLVAALMARGVRHGRQRWHDPAKPKLGKGKIVRGFFGFRMKPLV